MKIVYFILLHHKERQFEWLFSALYNPFDLFAIHVDKKSSRATYQHVTSLADGSPNVCFLPRDSIVWGGWSIDEVTLRAIKFLLELDGAWGYFINLSGQDYPIQPIDEIRSALAEAPSLNHLEAYTISSRPQREQAHLRRRMRWRCFEVGSRLIRTPIPKAAPRNLHVEWKGSGWYALSRDFCEWIAADDLTSECAAALRNMYIPDEFLMQTLAMNGPFSDTVTFDNRREIVWTGQPHPETLTMRHLSRLESSKAFFARKFDEAVDREVLFALAERTGAVPPAATVP